MPQYWEERRIEERMSSQPVCAAEARVDKHTWSKEPLETDVEGCEEEAGCKERLYDFPCLLRLMLYMSDPSRLRDVTPGPGFCTLCSSM
jgi:hypothetical protein